MKNECHIYRQSIVHERQSLDKTITSQERQIQSKYDNLGLGKTIQGKGRQFQIVYQALNQPERQYIEGEDNQKEGKTIQGAERQSELSCTSMTFGKTNLLSCSPSNHRQDKGIVLGSGETLGKTRQLNCLAATINHSARQFN